MVGVAVGHVPHITGHSSFATGPVIELLQNVAEESAAVLVTQSAGSTFPLQSAGIVGGGVGANVSPDNVGICVGAGDGEPVGDSVGLTVGIEVGSVVGVSVGFAEQPALIC